MIRQEDIMDSIFIICILEHPILKMSTGIKENYRILKQRRPRLVIFFSFTLPTSSELRENLN